jgi:hypothetical protein|tara:strand:+ start:263 stop:511 length:249 start_codon:yes stop_codon:yes gene_type:complete
MKTKDNLLKGIIIGIFVIVVPLILMSTTNYTTVNDEVGTFELEMSPQEDGTWVFETIIDTRTGQVISREIKRGLIKNSDYKK